MMKTLKIFSALLLIGFLFSSCVQNQCTSVRTYVKYTPIYKGYEEVKNSVASEEPRTINNPGKIYFKDDYILVNEINEGIHVIDVSNPSAPVNVSFINIPGNLDLSIMGHVLYADCFVDLISIDISDPQHIQVLDWDEDVFPNRVWFNGIQGNPDSGILIGWKEELVTDTIPCDDFNNIYYWQEGGVVYLDNAAMGGIKSGSSAGGGISSPGAGTGGSLARFTINNKHLYAIDQLDLHVFDLSNNEDPRLKNDISVAFNIETIFPYKDYLFIGGRSGVYIYDASDPELPVYLSEFTHANNCDPVVVQDDVAYVTLRDGTPCQGSSNQLDVLDVSDISNPTLIKSYPMSNPHGLGVDGNTLFICDGEAGLKVFDNSDLQNIDQHLLSTLKNGEKYLDIIPLGSSRFAIVMTDAGVCLYDYQNPSQLINLSCLPIILN